jgi:NADH-quinone oxidoreductase subunit M
VHTWLPLAHDQAPTGGSVILAGSMLKLGSSGVYRFAMPMAPAGGVELMVLMGILCLVAIVYASLICWVQQDAKKLVAYSSVAHLGLSMLGLFSLNPLGAEGSVFYWVNHGLSTGALFLCIGMFYERYHTKDMERLGGLARAMPVWACFMVFFVMASAGLPGLNGFVGEILCIGGTFIAEHDAQSGYPGVLGPSFAVVAGTGMILAAMYLLILLGKIVWGPLREPHDTHDEATGHPVESHTKLPRDLNGREIGILVPLAVACLALGLYPKPMLEAIAPCVEKTLAAYPAQVERLRAAETASLHGAGPAAANVADATASGHPVPRATARAASPTNGTVTR